MDKLVGAVLAEYEVRYEREFHDLIPALSGRDLLARRDGFLMSVGSETGVFLNQLIKSAKSKRILELGTAFGHSTVYLAEAARETGGRVVSCDLDSAKQHFAATMLRRARLDDYVSFQTGDAVDQVRSMKNEVDFCLLDLWNASYVPAFDAVQHKLINGAFLAADNMTVPDPDAGAGYREHVRKSLLFESVLLPLGWGIDVSRKRSPAVSAFGSR